MQGLSQIADNLAVRIALLEAKAGNVSLLHDADGNIKGRARSASFDALEAHCKHIEKVNRDLIDRVASLEAGLQATGGAATSQRAEVDSKVHSQLAIEMASEQRKQEFEKLNADLQGRINSLQADNADKLSLEQRRKQEFEKLNADLQVRVSSLRADNASNLSLEQRIQELERTNAELVEGIGANLSLEQHNKELERTNAELAERIGAKDFELSQVLAQVQAAQTAQATLASQLKEFQDRAKQAEDAFDALKSNSHTSEENKSCLKEIQHLQQSLQKAYHGQKSLSMMNQQSEEAKRQLEEENATLKTVMSAVQKSFQQAVEDKRLIKLKFAALEKDVQSPKVVPAKQLQSPQSLKLATPTAKNRAVRSPSMSSGVSTGTPATSTATTQSMDFSPPVPSTPSVLPAPSPSRILQATPLSGSSPSVVTPALSPTSPSTDKPRRQGYSYDPSRSPTAAKSAKDGSLRSRGLIVQSDRCASPLRCVSPLAVATKPASVLLEVGRSAAQSPTPSAATRTPASILLESGRSAQSPTPSAATRTPATVLVQSGRSAQSPSPSAASSQPGSMRVERGHASFTYNSFLAKEHSLPSRGQYSAGRQRMREIPVAGCEEDLKSQPVPYFYRAASGGQYQVGTVVTQ